MSETLYSDLFHCSTDGIIVINKRGEIKDANPSVYTIFGYEPGSLVGQKVNILMDHPHREAHDKYLREYREQKRAMSIQARKVPAVKKDGSPILIELQVFPLHNGRCAGIIRDLSGIEQSEKEKILEAEDRNLFAANISHELRTPLNSIINMNILLLDNMVEIEKIIPSHLYDEMLDRLDTAKHAGTLLLTQINDILDYSKLVSGKLTLRNQAFSVSECIDAALQLHKTMAKDKVIEIVSSLHPNIPTTLMGDPDRFSQVIINLLSNAMKFTEKGKIAINIWADNVDVATKSCILHMSITDTGIGISRKDQYLLFREFRQLDNSHTKKYQGTGLGLVICKKICQLMGGDIFLKHSEIGKGSNFELFVRMGMGDEMMLSFDKSLLSGKTVLIVDDEPANLMTFSTYILEWGMTPIQASSGEGALVYVKRDFKFDLAILDVRMQKMNGIELARKMKDAKVAYKLIGLSSVGRTAGTEIFDDMAEKPITKDKLLSLIMKNMLGKIPIKTSAEIPSMNLKDDDECDILIAEDNVDNQKVITQFLKKFGYKSIDVVGNGQEALDALEKKKYNIILMDIKMPVMSGLEASKVIHDRYGDKRPIIIALTAVATFGGEDFYVKEGQMDDYIPKPIDHNHLRKILSKHTGRK
jgi:PAS domain S-box-containing protein